MIVKIMKAGRSFKGLANYLTEKKERVVWTHSLNCANDDVLSVVHEMYTTYSQAELLKEQAGAHGGGRALDKPVKHIFLSWHESESLTREQMIEAAQSFLKEMGWDEHQALLVPHDDKKHQHVHIELNRVHPETGLALDDSFEKRRAQEWALAYEREQGNVLCKQRLLEPDERTPSPTRETWEKLRESEKAFEQEEKALRVYDPGYLAREDQRTVIVSEEWKILKAHQREEREAFFAEGKQEFKEESKQIYLRVREQFRDDWAEVYAAKRAGVDPDRVEEMRADVLERQRGVLDIERKGAFATLRLARDDEYKDLLLEQKQDRHELTARQELGQSSPHLLDFAGDRTPETIVESGAGLEADPYGVSRAFNAAAQDTCDRGASEPSEEEFERAVFTTAENPRVRDGLDGIGGIGLGALGGLAVISERLFDGFFGGSPPANQNQTPKPEPQPDRRPTAEARREQVALNRSIEAAIRAAEHEEKRDTEFWRERRRERE
jgi:hypothetical protein